MSSGPTWTNRMEPGVEFEVKYRGRWQRARCVGYRYPTIEAVVTVRTHFLPDREVRVTLRVGWDYMHYLDGKFVP